MTGHFQSNGRRQNLLAAASFVESIPEERFNMAHWWLEEGIAFDDDRNSLYKVADGPCGCAVGNMVQAGLFALEASDLENDRQRIFVIVSDKLGLFNYKLAEFMFDQYAYLPGPATREIVARRIRFVASESE